MLTWASVTCPSGVVLAVLLLLVSHTATSSTVESLHSKLQVVTDTTKQPLDQLNSSSQQQQQHPPTQAKRLERLYQRMSLEQYYSRRRSLDFMYGHPLKRASMSRREHASRLRNRRS